MLLTFTPIIMDFLLQINKIFIDFEPFEYFYLLEIPIHPLYSHTHGWGKKKKIREA